jgi:hypothetical protein
MGPLEAAAAASASQTREQHEDRRRGLRATGQHARPPKTERVVKRRDQLAADARTTIPTRSSKRTKQQAARIVINRADQRPLGTALLVATLALSLGSGEYCEWAGRPDRRPSSASGASLACFSFIRFRPRAAPSRQLAAEGPLASSDRPAASVAIYDALDRF